MPGAAGRMSNGPDMRVHTRSHRLECNLLQRSNSKKSENGWPTAPKLAAAFDSPPQIPETCDLLLRLSG